MDVLYLRSFLFRITNDSVKRGSLIGRGAFGFVYEAFVRQQRGSFTGGSQSSPSRPQSGGNGVGRSVAIKMLQPMHPGAGASENTLAAFKAGQSKWERDPPQYACKAYCTARQELNILIHLKVRQIILVLTTFGSFICSFQSKLFCCNLFLFSSSTRTLFHWSESV